MHRSIFKRISVLNLAVQFFFFVSMIDNKLLLREVIIKDFIALLGCVLQINLRQSRKKCQSHRMVFH